MVPEPLRHADADVSAASVDQLELLMVALKARDQAALGRLYDLTVDRVNGMAMRVLGVIADAEEVVVDVYRQVWQRAGSFDPERGSVMSWLMVIAHSRALDHLRRRQARPDRSELQALSDEAVGAHEPQHPVEDLLDALQSGTRVHDALARIRPEQRRLIGMAFLRGMSHLEIADATGLPMGTVKSHIRRGLAALKSLLENAGARHED